MSQALEKKYSVYMYMVCSLHDLHFWGDPDKLSNCRFDLTFIAIYSL